MVAGIYGMNFENMPELKWDYGYYFSLAVMVVVDLVPLRPVQEDPLAVGACDGGARRRARAPPDPCGLLGRSTGATGITRPSGGGTGHAGCSVTWSMREVAREHPLRRGERARPRRAVGEHHVRRQRDALGAHVPHVQVVDAGDARQPASARPIASYDRCAGTRSISTPVDCRSSASVERRISSATTSDRIGSIGIQPVAVDDGAGDERRDRAQQVAEHVQQRAARVDAAARARQASTRRRG